MRARLVWCVLLAVALAPGVAFGAAAGGADSASTPARPDGYVFPSRRQQLRAWALNASGPAAIAGNLAAASWRQWVTEQPPKWDTDGAGFAKRFGTASLTTAISETSVSLTSALMRQDAGYYRAPASGLRPRLRHAVAMTFLARDVAGDRVFSPAKTFSYFVGPAVTQASFYPEGYTAADVLVSGAYTLLINAGLNVAYEFVLGAPAWE